MFQISNIVDRLVEFGHNAEALAVREILHPFEHLLTGDAQNSPPSPASTSSQPPIEIPGVEWVDGAFHPSSVEQVRDIVLRARARGLRVRTAGAQHSTVEAVYSPNAGDIRVILDGELRRVEFESEEPGVVKVGGGCYLGLNPVDPRSTWENSLNVQLDARGLALPLLGGISHQTISGFMQTSSSGGSLQHSFAEAVRSIEFVDGTGAIQTVEVGSDEFAAAGVSMGLFGIITHVVVACEAQYFVTGTESNHEEADSLLQLDQGHYPLEAALARIEYLHLDWYPQAEVRRVTQWLGKRTAPSSDIQPYKSELKGELLNVIAAIVLKIASGALAIDPNGAVAKKLVGALLRSFVPLNKKKEFSDLWYKVLPSDDQVKVDTLIKLIFTEIWLPLSQLTEAMRRLTEILSQESVAGNFAVELYGAKQSPFWLSPSFETDVVRVDVFWWAYNFGDPAEHFSHFWNVLLELPGARLHWGKNLPSAGQQCGSVVFGPNFVRDRYGRFSDWLLMRERFDPDKLFVTDYWKSILGL